MLMLAAAALLAAGLGYALVLRLFPRWGLLDFPQRYGLNRPRLPYPAGIVAVVLFLAIFVLISDIELQELGVMLGIVILATVCFLDDRTPLPPYVRLGVQIFVAVLIFATGSRIYTVTSPLGGFLKLDALVIHAGPLGNLPVLSGVFTVVWLLFTINALNWFDGIGGQVSVLSVIGFLMLGLLAYFRNGEVETAQIAFILAGLAAAGAAFDFPPATLLLGDTGSMFFGLMLGVLGIYSGGKVATVFLALGIPLLDAAFVIMRRLAQGTSPLKGGRDHLHHLLLDKGWSERKIIVLMALVGTLFGGTALFMSTSQKGVALVVLFVLMLGVTNYASKK